MLRNSSYFLFAFLVVPVSFGSLATKVEAATLLYSNDFEKGLGNVGLMYECRNDQFNVVSSQARAGKHSLRVNQDGHDYCLEFGDKRSRSFVVPGAKPADGYRLSKNNLKKADVRFKQDHTYWVGFSVYLPSNFPTKDRGGFAFWNMKNGLRGETYIYVRKEVWEFSATKWPKNQGPTGKTLAELPVRPSLGKWTDFVFEIRRSQTNNGLVRAWMNGKKVAEYHGVLGTDYVGRGRKPPYARLGMYWGKERRDKDYTLYLDSIKIAEGANGYNLVSSSRPGSLKPPRPVQNVRLTN